MSGHIVEPSTLAVTRINGDIVMTLSPKQAQILAASVWLGNANHPAWLDTMADLLVGAANGHDSTAPAGSTVLTSTTAPTSAFAETVPTGTVYESEAELEAAQALQAAAVNAAVIAERAVSAAADRAKAAAVAAQEARAAATDKIASVMAETVKQQVLAVQAHANAEAREVAAAAARAASRVASAVLPGREVEARRAALFVAQMTTEAAAATAEETALVAAAAARAAAAAALSAAAEAADAAMLVELEVQGTAKAIRDIAEAAAHQVAETYRAVGRINP